MTKKEILNTQSGNMAIQEKSWQNKVYKNCTIGYTHSNQLNELTCRILLKFAITSGKTIII